MFTKTELALLLRICSQAENETIGIDEAWNFGYEGGRPGAKRLLKEKVKLLCDMEPDLFELLFGRHNLD